MRDASSMTGAVEPGTSDPRALRRETLNVVALGIGVGIVSLVVTSLELRWTLYLFAAVVLVTVLGVARDRERLLTTIFLLSLQIDVYIRFFYGRAGTSGLEFPLSFCTGAALWAQMYLNQGRRGTFVWFGELERPIKLLLATSIVSALFSSEHFAAVSRIVFELQLVLVYAVAMNLVRREGGVKSALAYLAFTLAIQTTLCIVQSRLGINFSFLGDVSDLGDLPRPGGTVSTNPAGFASFVMPMIMVVSARFVNRDRAHRGWADGILALLGITAIILTLTRAAWSALGLGLAYITVVGIRRRYITGRQLTIIAVGLLGVSIAAAPLIKARLDEAPLGDSYDERANLNHIAINIIMHYPVFGVGPGAYNYTFKEYLPSGADKFWLAGVHNEYLMRTAETGLVGGYAFVWVLLVGLRQARRLSRSTDPTFRIFGLGWAAGILALAWQMYWVPWRGFSYNSMLWLFLGMAEALTYLEHQRTEHLSLPNAATAAASADKSAA